MEAIGSEGTVYCVIDDTLSPSTYKASPERSKYKSIVQLH